jgi:hypothetical protein
LKTTPAAADAAAAAPTAEPPQTKRFGVSSSGGGGGFFVWSRFLTQCPRCRRAGRAADVVKVHAAKPDLVISCRARS